jgi:signal transduction histidine kinase
MMIRDQVIGGLTVSHASPGYFTTHHASLLRSFASQTAVAIENARLYEKAQELAALEERSRLARELHDSVSQALYGIGLAAETTRLLLDTDPARAARSNATVLSLAQAGMAEMRALIFELRPESLELEGLAGALQKQTQALEARYEIPVESTLCGEPAASLPVKEALYRIAQEALHNAIKHAQPTRMELRLECARDEVRLEVRDDGRGFDPSGSFPGHLGLRSMEERAARLGGTVEIDSSPGKGTRVRVRLPAAGRR